MYGEWAVPAAKIDGLKDSAVFRGALQMYQRAQQSSKIAEETIRCASPLPAPRVQLNGPKSIAVDNARLPSAEAGPVTHQQLGSAESIVELLIKGSEKCSGGVRVLYLPDARPPWIDALTGADKEWALNLIAKDSEGGQLLILAINRFRQITIAGYPNNLSASLKKVPVGLRSAGNSFVGWAGACAGSCGEAAAHDSAVWAEWICKGTGVSWANYEGRVRSAQALGRTEEKQLGDLKTKAERSLSQLILPSNEMKLAGYVDKDDAEKYLIALFLLNREKPVAVLAKEWKAQRAEYAGVWKGEGVIEWEAVRKKKR